MFIFQKNFKCTLFYWNVTTARLARLARCTKASNANGAQFRCFHRFRWRTLTFRPKKYNKTKRKMEIKKDESPIEM